MAFLPLIMYQQEVYWVSLVCWRRTIRRDKRNYQLVYVVAAVVSLISVLILVPGLFANELLLHFWYIWIYGFLGMLWFNKKIFCIKNDCFCVHIFLALFVLSLLSLQECIVCSGSHCLRTGRLSSHVYFNGSQTSII